MAWARPASADAQGADDALELVPIGRAEPLLVLSLRATLRGARVSVYVPAGVADGMGDDERVVLRAGSGTRISCTVRVEARTQYAWGERVELRLERLGALERRRLWLLARRRRGEGYGATVPRQLQRRIEVW